MVLVRPKVAGRRVGMAQVRCASDLVWSAGAGPSYSFGVRISPGCAWHVKHRVSSLILLRVVVLSLATAIPDLHDVLLDQITVALAFV